MEPPTKTYKKDIDVAGLLEQFKGMVVTDFVTRTLEQSKTVLLRAYCYHRLEQQNLPFGEICQRFGTKAAHKTRTSLVSHPSHLKSLIIDSRMYKLRFIVPMSKSADFSTLMDHYDKVERYLQDNPNEREWWTGGDVFVDTLAWWIGGE